MDYYPGRWRFQWQFKLDVLWSTCTQIISVYHLQTTKKIIISRSVVSFCRNIMREVIFDDFCTEKTLKVRNTWKVANLIKRAEKYCSILLIAMQLCWLIEGINNVCWGNYSKTFHLTHSYLYDSPYFSHCVIDRVLPVAVIVEIYQDC